jgi:hypothetical protein
MGKWKWCKVSDKEEVSKGVFARSLDIVSFLKDRDKDSDVTLYDMMGSLLMASAIVYADTLDLADEKTLLEIFDKIYAPMLKDFVHTVIKEGKKETVWM